MQQAVIDSFYQNRNNDRAAGMAAYMKNKFSFLGLLKPERERLQLGFINQAKKTAFIDWEFVFQLWALPEREFQYLAIDYLLALQRLLHGGDIDKLKLLITTKSWWDTVDVLAGNIVGGVCVRYPELVKSQMLSWAESDNIWLVRTAILFQLKYKASTDTGVLSLIILKNNGSKEFFINKAIGWALREYSKTNKEWVKIFIENSSLQPLSVREGSKYI